MAGKLFKETFNGAYDGVTPAPLLEVGSIADGENVRMVSARGGWKARKGCTIHNTTKLNAGNSVLSLHRFEHPTEADFHFLAQSNGSLYDASDQIPAAGTTFAGSALSALASSTQRGFSDMVVDSWLYGDGSGAPVMWGGDTPHCSGFVVHDNSEDAYSDYTSVVIDGRDDTEAIVLGAASDVYYVCSPCIAKGINLDLGDTVNAVVATATVKSWQSAAWSDRSATDGTASGGATHAVDGNLTWTASASDTMRVIGGIMGYWYQVSFSGALTGSVDVISCKVQYDPARVSNKWSGIYSWPLAVRFYDQSTGEYEDYSGKLLNESTSLYLQLDAMTTSDYIYVKAKEPLTGIGLGVSSGYENTANAQITAADGVEHWDGDSWVTNAIQTDETLDDTGDTSFAATGTVWWNAAGATVKRRTMDFDSVPGYWYRISVDAAPDNTDDDVRVFMVTTATFPESLGAYDGVVEFKGRAMLWGESEHPNRLRYSAYERPDCFSGGDSDYTDAFGDKSKIIMAVRFHNELAVFKKDSVWLLEGYNGATFGNMRMADTTGCVAAATVCVGEAGQPTVYAHEVLTVVGWLDSDGVYLDDGRKTKKVSGPVDHYFNPEFSTCLTAAQLSACQAFIDKNNSEYHLLLPTGTELVYNYVLDAWYPPWDRRVGDSDDYLVSGISVRGKGSTPDDRYYTYAGNNDGLVFRLENDTTDKDASNADVKITHSVKTRAIGFDQNLSTTLEFDFRKAWVEAKARASGTITTNFFKDMATSGTALTAPAAISLVNSGYSMTADGVQTGQSRCHLFQLEFAADTADLELEIWSFAYQVNLVGEVLP